MMRLIGLLTAALLMAAPAAAWAGKDVKNVLMVLWRIETEYDAAFKARLAELGVDVRYQIMFGKEDRDYLAESLRAASDDFGSGRYDLVYTWGSTVSKIVDHVNNGRTPLVFNVVYDPVEIGLAPETGRSKRPVTGATNGVPVEDQFDAFAKIAAIPKLCMIFNPRERNADLALERVIGWTNKNKVPFEYYRTVPGTDGLEKLLAMIKSGEKECPVIYSGADSYMGSQAKNVHQALGDKSVLLGGTERFVLNGWAMAFAPTVQSMGFAAGDLAAKVLQGQSAADLGVVLPQPKIIVSKAAADKHGLKLPDGVEMRD